MPPQGRCWPANAWVRHACACGLKSSRERERREKGGGGGGRVGAVSVSGFRLYTPRAPRSDVEWRRSTETLAMAIGAAP